jgi:hypothetical protein
MIKLSSKHKYNGVFTISFDIVADRKNIKHIRKFEKNCKLKDIVHISYKLQINKGSYLGYISDILKLYNSKNSSKPTLAFTK